MSLVFMLIAGGGALAYLIIRYYKIFTGKRSGCDYYPVSFGKMNKTCGNCDVCRSCGRLQIKNNGDSENYNGKTIKNEQR